MGVTYLLDTHVLLWLLGEPERVPAEVRAELARPAHRLLVSAVSALEVSTKVRLDKLDGQHLVDTWPERLAQIGAEELSVTCRHSLLAGALPWPHRDPFDRLLVAQTSVEGATLVTSDARIRALGTVRLLAW